MRSRSLIQNGIIIIDLLLAMTAVRQKAYNLGIKTRELHLWSANEVKLLKKLYPSENTQNGPYVEVLHQSSSGRLSVW